MHGEYQNCQSGESLDLQMLPMQQSASLEHALNSRYVNKKSQYETYQDFGTRKKHLEMLSMYSHLEPQKYQRTQGSKQSLASHKVLRDSGRSIDFGEWFGKPCIIVVGYYYACPIPVPLSVDGDESLDSSGLNDDEMGISTAFNTMMIQTTNLTKKYGELIALDNLNLEIEEGECYGFIGPNGAGKTTTIKILSTLFKTFMG